MIKKSEIVKLLEDRDEAGLNDVLACEIRKQIAEKLGNDEDEIMELLYSLNDYALYTISEVFDILVVKLQSETFISRLIELSDNRPNAEIGNEINAII